jgi:type IV pilus assembly protein PilM
MPGRATHVLGVDIGNEVLKVVELRLTGRGIELLGMPAVAPTPRGSVAGGVVVDTGAVAEALKSMLRARGFSSKKAVVSVGGDTSTVVRIADMPRMAGKELAEAVRWELDRQAPFPIDRVATDYAPIEFADLPRDEQTMQVLLAVAQEDMVTAHISALKAAGLTTVAVDIEALAISRALVNSANGKYAEQTVLLCNIGATATGIYFVRKGTLNFVRTIPSAGETITAAIRQRLSDTEEEAERLKREFADLRTPESGFQPGAAAADNDALAAQEEVTDVVASTVLDIATELRRSIEYYRRQHRNEEVNGILLTGGTALIPGMAEFIATETGIETHVGNPFERVRVPEDADTAAYLSDIAPLAVVATGLAMRDMVD